MIDLCNSPYLVEFAFITVTYDFQPGDRFDKRVFNTQSDKTEANRFPDGQFGA